MLDYLVSVKADIYWQGSILGWIGSGSGLMITLLSSIGRITFGAGLGTVV